MHQVQMVCYAPVDQMYGISQSLRNIHPECNALNMLKCNTQNALRKRKGPHGNNLCRDDVADRAIKTKTYQVLTNSIQHKMGQTGRYMKCNKNNKK